MRRRDVRGKALALAVSLIAALGAAIWFAGEERAAPGSAEFDARFRQAALLLHAREYEHAAALLHRLLQDAPRVPEVHANMGYAMLGLKRPAAARDFFQGAIELRPAQANAYFGLAEALEALGDRRGALGAMRAYVHLSPPHDPFVRKAQAAVWELENPPAKERAR